MDRVQNKHAQCCGLSAGRLQLCLISVCDHLPRSVSDFTCGVIYVKNKQRKANKVWTGGSVTFQLRHVTRHKRAAEKSTFLNSAQYSNFLLLTGGLSQWDQSFWIWFMVWSLADNWAWRRNPAGSNQLIANPDQRAIKKLNQTERRFGLEGKSWHSPLALRKCMWWWKSK